MPNGTPFIETEPMLDSESLLAMGEAFDRVLAVITDDETGNVTLETAAAIIIARAGDGERDPDRLVDFACGKVGIPAGRGDRH